MVSETLTYHPSCQPDTWILLIGPDRYASAAIDPFNRFLLQAEWSDLDLYKPDFFSQQAKTIFTERTEIRKIRVCFLLPEMFWTPTSLEAEVPASHGPTSSWPEKAGHSWITDNIISADATAWVRAPQQVLHQLNQLTTSLEYKHCSVFSVRERPATGHQLEILRVGQTCWFSLWQAERFLYAQPHRVTNADDLLYVLSLLADQYDLPTERLNLTLSGDWSLDSPCLTPLRQRFEKLHTRESTWKKLPGEHPAHWYTPLEDIFSCA